MPGTGFKYEPVARTSALNLTAPRVAQKINNYRNACFRQELNGKEATAVIATIRINRGNKYFSFRSAGYYCEFY